MAGLEVESLDLFDRNQRQLVVGIHRRGRKLTSTRVVAIARNSQSGDEFGLVPRFHRLSPTLRDVNGDHGARPRTRAGPTHRETTSFAVGVYQIGEFQASIDSAV
jgi:hypothetical protein